ncbi:MAG TPA: DMT family transporter [Candidatus Nitrosocosmicus sp.]|nr:DMT family transporter [Candidatus Nitrosocosmicus sp.]
MNKADLVLLVVCAIWGTTFSLLRDSLRSIHPAELMALRFTMGTIVLLAAFPRRVFPLRREAFQRGGVIGIFLASGYLTQVIGLATITAARSAFLTSTYILFTPFLAIPLVGEVPRLGELLGVAIGFAGLTLFSADAGFSLRPGDLWTLGCALSFGIQIALTNVAGKRVDPVALSVVQMAVGALAGWTIVIARGGFLTPWSQVPWAILLYLSVVATAVVIALQAWALARVSPVRASMIFATEPIFAALFAVAFFAERMSAREILGAAVILLGVAVTILWKPWMERREARRAAHVAMGRS